MDFLEEDCSTVWAGKYFPPTLLPDKLRMSSRLTPYKAAVTPSSLLFLIVATAAMHSPFFFAATHARPFVGAFQVRSWSHWFVLGAILWAFIAKIDKVSEK